VDPRKVRKIQEPTAAEKEKEIQV
jgi:hypothetical protein